MPKCRLDLCQVVNVLLEIGSDDFLYWETFMALARVSFVAMIAAAMNILLANDDWCSAQLWILSGVAIGFHATFFMVNVATAYGTSRGAIMQPQLRTTGNWLISHQLLLLPIEFGLALWGVLATYKSNECAQVRFMSYISRCC